MAKDEDKTHEEIVSTSGNSFHCRVIDTFRNAGWRVLVSPYYIDASTDVAREVDLLCEREWKYPAQWAEQPRALRIKLVVECKYIANNTVFWFDDRDEQRAERAIVERLSCLKDNVNIRAHHYNSAASRTVAKLFASKQVDREPLFTALSQVLGGLQQMSYTESLLPSPKGYRTTQVCYPVVVCSSFQKFRRTTVAVAGALEPIDSNFLWEVNYARPLPRADVGTVSVPKYSLIDVVSLDKVADFFAALDEEAKAIGNVL